MIKKVNFLILFILLFVISFNSVKALDVDYGNGEYAITKYDIEIVVNEDNSFDIKETIGAYFHVEKHGIIRNLPLSNSIYRENEKWSYNRAKVSDIYVTDINKIYTENDIKYIKIGDPDITVTGSKTYGIDYKYSLSRDDMADYDEVYYNIVGSEWDTTINNVSFKITMPKDFDSSKIAFIGRYLEPVETGLVNYYVIDNVITGNYIGRLEKGIPLTIKIELPQGYFNVPTSFFEYAMLMVLLVPCLLLMIIIYLWFKNGRDAKVVEVLEFNAPDNLNSAEIGYIYKGFANNTDVVSLLIYLANKGYIKIEHFKQSKNDKYKNTFKIIKVKDYDGNNKAERIFIEGLFEDGANEVTQIDLRYKFFYTALSVKNELNEMKEKIIKKESSFGRVFTFISIVISILIINGIPAITYLPKEEIYASLLLSLFFVPPFVIMLFKKDYNKIISYLIDICLIIYLALFVLLAYTFSPIMPLTVLYPAVKYGILLGSISIIFMQVFEILIESRTEYGNIMLGRIKGFKRFLKKVEKSNLEKLVNENPKIFYDILPYTFALGISRKWIKKFESITIEPIGNLDMDSFESSMNDITSLASLSYDSSSDGGSSGGSSGGSGGGGGSSW